jgi:hypothetical protein
MLHLRGPLETCVLLYSDMADAESSIVLALGTISLTFN